MVTQTAVTIDSAATSAPSQNHGRRVIGDSPSWTEQRTDVDGEFDGGDYTTPPGRAAVPACGSPPVNSLDRGGCHMFNS
jgi:hypothetical protein